MNHPVLGNIILMEGINYIFWDGIYCKTMPQSEQVILPYLMAS